MSATREPQTTNLFLLEELEDASRTTALGASDLDALRAVAEWIRTYVARPHEDLGRAGPVCPFVPGALERQTLWIAPEQSAGRSVPEVAERIMGYHELFMDTPPTDGSGAGPVHKAFVVVFADLPADRAGDYFDAVLARIAVPSYVNGGFVMGGFFEGNEATAIYNATFRPFTSPAPFLLVRQTVVSDWKFFLDDDEQLAAWARRFGDAGSRALAEELRRLPWRAGPA